MANLAETVLLICMFRLTMAKIRPSALNSLPAPPISRRAIDVVGVTVPWHTKKTERASGDTSDLSGTLLIDGHTDGGHSRPFIPGSIANRIDLSIQAKGALHVSE